ncbi:DNA polymerase V [Fusarium austroafricanum]|uniref:DNA polymerase V n=1 Tax=Fusarium austroafricanum TaxID=2364996 RepID=A0A8H4KSG2_9HYPO|nr:DNA polymerase V [Fusarium austroafricanum]
MNTELDPPLFVENPDSDERKRQAELYELLGSDDPDERTNAAECIILSLLHGDGVSEAVLRHHLDHRLFRGLASGRNASRLGFSVVLQELLRQLFGDEALSESTYKDLTFNAVLEMMTQKTHSTGNVSGKEERDHLIGRLFGIMSFVTAKILFGDMSRWIQVLSLLLDLAHNTVWLRSACGWVIIESIPQMTKEQARVTLEKIDEAHLSRTPEGLSIWLVALSRFPDLKVQPWPEPLSKKCFGDLAAVLRESFQHFEDELDLRQKNKQSNWTAQLHYAWDILLAHFVKQGQAGAGEFKQFWIHVVDDSLFSQAATDGQKFKGFMAFQRMLEGLVDLPLHLEALFSKNIIRCLMNQAAQKQRYLHRAAMKALKAIESTTSVHPLALTPILKGLLGQNGDYGFDHRTKTKTIERILQNVTGKTVDEVIKVIQKPLDTLGQLQTTNAKHSLRTYARYLSAMLSASASTTARIVDDSVFLAALPELFQLAYGQPEHIPGTALTGDVKKFCQDCIKSSFAKVSRRSADYGTLCRAVSSIDHDTVAMDETAKTTVQKAVSSMRELLSREAADNQDRILFSNLATLYAVLVFQLYDGHTDAVDGLNDLEKCLASAGRSDSVTDSDTDSDSDSDTSVFILDTLMSMFTQRSTLMRQVCKEVFDSITPHISADGLASLTGNLSAPENMYGYRALFRDSGDETEDDTDEDENEEEENANNEDNLDVGTGIHVDLTNTGEPNGNSEFEEDSEDEGDGNKGESDNDKELNDALGKLLKTHSLDKDVDTDSSESEVGMSDAQMLLLDAKLVETLRPRIQALNDGSTKKHKEAKELVIYFKSRILDLLHIYVRKECCNSLSFAILVPLLDLVRTTRAKHLAKHACEIIHDYQKGLRKARKKGQHIQAPVQNDLMMLLRDIHDAAGKYNGHEYAKAASTASLIVVAALVAIDQNNLRHVCDVYSQTMAGLPPNGNVQVQKFFFEDWNNWRFNAV